MCLRACPWMVLQVIHVAYHVWWLCEIALTVLEALLHVERVLVVCEGGVLAAF